MTMTDEEYKAFLIALAAKYLRPDRLSVDDVQKLREALALATRISRLNQLAKDDDGRSELTERLKGELLQSPLPEIERTMEKSGLLEALDEGKGEIFWNLRTSVIPEEDFRLLREAGFVSPEADIALWVRYANGDLAQRYPQKQPTDIVMSADAELKKAAEQIPNAASHNAVSQSPAKKRKLFNGIGKILGGAIAGAGNVLMACGTIIAPNPATIYGAISSGAIAVAGIGQGIGDLRGE